MRTFLFLALAIVCGPLAAIEPAATVLEAEKARIAAIEKASASFIGVFVAGGGGGGSGVVISSDGFALTNFHVAKPAGSHMKCGMNDGKMYDAVIVGLDPTGDIALIKLLGRDDFPPAAIADSDAVRVGDAAFAVGNPFILATNLQPTVTCGIVSGMHRCQYPAGTLLEYTDAIQTDASINPGNSGGPLFNARGELIGIIGSGSFDKRGRVNVGVGYAISINQVKNFLGSLKSGRLVDHATLGATVATDEKGRVFVDNILETSDAFRRGLRYGDEIHRFGGRSITSANGFKSVLGMFPKGWSVPLTYKRAGKERTITVRLAGLLSQEELNAKAVRAFEEQRPPAPDANPPDKGPPGKAPPDKEKEGKEKPPAKKKPSDAHKLETPPEIAKLLEIRPGYANRYFNRLELARVTGASANRTAAPVGSWKVAGTLASGEKCSLTLLDTESLGEFTTGLVKIDDARDYDAQLDPPASGGLAVSLHLWRLLAVQGVDRFGDVTYHGTRPREFGGPMLDIISAVRGTALCEVWCDPKTGRWERFDVILDDEADPCSLRFTYAEENDSSWTPSKIEVFLGEERTAELEAPVRDEEKKS